MIAQIIILALTARYAITCMWSSLFLPPVIMGPAKLGYFSTGQSSLSLQFNWHLSWRDEARKAIAPAALSWARRYNRVILAMRQE